MCPKSDNNRNYCELCVEKNSNENYRTMRISIGRRVSKLIFNKLCGLKIGFAIWNDKIHTFWQCTNIQIRH